MADAAMPTADATPALPLTLGYATGETRGRRFGWPHLLLLIAVVLRLAYSATKSNDPASLINLPDQVEYWQIARSVLQGEGLRFDDPATSEFLYAFRMPGYPLFVAACGAVLPIVRTAQAGLDGASVLAVYFLARRLRGPTAGIVAGLLVALHPYLIYFSATLLSETLFAALLTWGTICLLSYRQKVRLLGVVVLLSGVFVRPSAIGLGIAAAGMALYGGRRPAMRAVTAMAAAAAVLAGALGLWAVRNDHVLRHAAFLPKTNGLTAYVWTTTNSGYTAYDSFNPAADGSSDQKAFRVTMTDPAVAAAIDVPLTQPYHQWEALRLIGEVGRDRLFNRLAWDYARQHPARAATLAFAKLARFWSPWPMSSDFGDWKYVLVGSAFVVPFFGLVVVGIRRGGLGRRATLILLLPAIYFSVVHCVFVGSLRYRVPCDVPLAVLAGCGAASLVRPKAVRE